MGKTIVILTLLALGIATTNADLKKECMEGPAYWCKNEENAQSCKVEQYCQLVIWKSNNAPADTCATCKQYVGMVSALVANKETQAEILTALKSACSLLPSAYQGVCSELVTAYGQQIIDAVVDYLKDPAKLCTELGLCKGGKPNKIALAFIKNAPKVQVGSDKCSTCKEYVGTAYLVVSKKETQAEILSAMKSACSSLPSFGRGMCEELVSAYGQQFMDRAVAYLKDPTNLCTKLGLCSGQVTPFLTKVDADYCTMCKQYVGTAYMLLMNKQAQAEVMDAMKSACSLLPSSAKGACTELVTAFGQEIIDGLVAYLKNPTTLCTTLGVCSSAEMRSTSPYVIKTSATLDTCTTCKQYVGTVYLLISNKATQAEVITALKSACSLLPSAYQGVCSELVTAYGQQAIDAVVAYLKDPAKLCTTLGLCSGTPNKIALKLLEGAMKIKTPQDTCSTCKQYEAMVYGLLASKETQAEILTALKSACSLLPASYQGACAELVTAYGQQVIDAAVGYLKDPVKVCTTLGMCKGTDKIMFRKMTPQDTCATCKQYEAVVYGLLESKETQAEIITALKSACSLLPASAQGVCSELVTTYGQQVIDAAVGYLKDPVKVCTALGMCKGTDKIMFRKMFTPIQVKPEVGADYCTMCKQYAGTVYMLVQNKDTQAEILSAMKSACSLLPTSAQGMCSELVTAYGQQVIDAAVAYLKDPTKVCTALGLCSGKMRTLPILIKSTAPSDTCSTCKQYEAMLYQLLQSKETQAEILSALKSACALLPASAQGVCSELVTAYGQQVIDAAVGYLKDPVKVCTTLGMCKGTEKTIKITPIPINPKGGQTTPCLICTYIADQVLKDVKANAPALLAEAKSLCSKLPEGSAECLIVVEMYGQKAIDAIAKLEPATICKAIKLCKSNTKVSTVKVDSFQCDICMLVMGKLDDLIKEDESKIEDLLDKVCTVLPDAYKTECVALVKQYGDLIIKFIVEEMDPKGVCVFLKLCSAQKYFLHKYLLLNKVEAVTPVKVESLQCDLCMMVMENLEKVLTSNATEEDVVKALDKVCTILPAQYAAECKSLVETYADKIVEIIAQELDPKTVCVLIKLCSAQKYFDILRHKVLEPKKQVPMKKVGDTVQCEICMTAVNYLVKILKENETRQSLKDELKQICEYLPAGYQAECDTMIDTYTDQIIDLLIEQMKPKDICTELGLCQAKYEVRTIHSPNKFAPSVSCKSSEFMMGFLAQRLHSIKLGGSMPPKDHLKWILAAMCAQLPKGKRECNTLVQKYGSKIQSLIVDHKLKPNVISKQLGLCTLGDSKKMKYISYSSYKLGLMRPKSISCTVCQYAMGYVVSALKTEKTEQALAIKFKTLVCAKLPEKALVNECGALIDNYGSELVDLLLKKVDALSLCEALDICT